MKKAIIASLALAAAASAYGQGQIKIDNLIGAGIVSIQNADGTIFSSTTANVQLYRYDAAAAGGIGGTLGSQITGITANGRFKGDTVTVDGVKVGQTVGLILRAWDGGATYDKGTIRGTSANWTSGKLGGIDDANNPVLTPKLDGFASFKVAAVTTTTTSTTQGSTTTTGAVPEPSTIALGALGAAALVLRRRK